MEEPKASDAPLVDLQRTARQTGFNFVWYGPLQHYWYIALGKWFPMSGTNLATNFQPFAIKVFLNQAVLGPVVVSTFFAATLAAQVCLLFLQLCMFCGRASSEWSCFSWDSTQPFPTQPLCAGQAGCLFREVQS